jgi:hypothetical protein
MHDARRGPEEEARRANEGPERPRAREGRGREASHHDLAGPGGHPSNEKRGPGWSVGRGPGRRFVGGIEGWVVAGIGVGSSQDPGRPVLGGFTAGDPGRPVLGGVVADGVSRLVAGEACRLRGIELQIQLWVPLHPVGQELRFSP